MIFFNEYSHFRGGGNTSRAVIVPGTTIGSGAEIPPVIRAVYKNVYKNVCVQRQWKQTLRLSQYYITVKQVLTAYSLLTAYSQFRRSCREAQVAHVLPILFD